MNNSIMSKSLHDSSFSFSRRYFNCNNRFEDSQNQNQNQQQIFKNKKPPRPISKLQTALTLIRRIRPTPHRRTGVRLIGTLFGHRRGHVYFAIQEDPKQSPTFLIELPTPTSTLVREMSTGLVRIALECEKKPERKKNSCKLVEEPVWGTFCNGKKCGFASRREFGAEEQKILKAVEPITMGAGVLPAAEGKLNGELMYMRARFERVVGSKDSEAFYMMSPDFNGGPELSIYLLRI